MKIDKVIQLLDKCDESDIDFSKSRVYWYLHFHLTLVSAVAMECFSAPLKSYVDADSKQIQTILCRVILPKPTLTGFRTAVKAHSILCSGKLGGYFRLANEESISQFVTHHILFQRYQDTKDITKDVQFILKEMESRKGEVSLYQIEKGRIFDKFYFLQPKQNVHVQKDSDYDHEPFLGRHIVQFFKGSAAPASPDDEAIRLISALSDSWERGLNALDYFTFDGHFGRKFSRFIFEDVLNQLYVDKHEKARHIQEEKNGKDETQLTHHFYDFSDQNKDEVVGGKKDIDTDEKDEKESQLKSEQEVVFVSRSGKSSEKISLDILMHCKYFSTNEKVLADNKIWKVQLRTKGDIDDWTKFLLSDGTSKVKRKDLGKIYQFCNFVDSSKWRRVVAKFIATSLLNAPLAKLDEFCSR